MRTVASLIRELQKFPPDAMCHAYEGERCGLTVMSATAEAQIGFVDASESGDDESDKAADEERIGR